MTAIQRAQTDCSTNITSILLRDVPTLLNELRSKCYAAMSQPAPSKRDQFDVALQKAQGIFDSSLEAIRTRLQVAQDTITNTLSSVEGSDKDLAPLRNCLTDYIEIAEMKRDSILAQARARELQSVDSIPYGSWTFVYDAEGSRCHAQISTTAAYPQQTAPAGVQGGVPAQAPGMQYPYAAPYGVPQGYPAAAYPQYPGYPPYGGYPPQPGM